jgi:hypothetical protein
MAELRLKKSATVNQINDLLNSNLSGGIVPIEKNIPEITSKGIYFWYLESQKGYKNLSQFVDIGPVENCLSRIVDGVKYDLVYAGTAGVIKQEKSNLTVRLKWHIAQKHTESLFTSDNPAISTLRSAIGSLLSDDLIIGNTEKKVNDFMKDNMRVFWIEYPNDKKLIDSDETILIDVVKPLINIKNNSNAKKNALNNPTKTYKARRIEVIEATKARLKGEDKSASKTAKAKNNGGKVPPKKPAASIEGEAQKSPNDFNKCMSFNVKQNESAADVAGNIKGLPVGLCTIEVKDKITGVNLFVSGHGNPVRKINTVGRTVKKYFNSTNNRDEYKWEELQNEMIEKKVKEVRVTVCPIVEIDKLQKSALALNYSPIVISSKSKKTVKTSSQKQNKSSDNAIENKSELAKVIIKKVIKSIDFDKLNSKPKLLIISCSGSKLPGGNINLLQDYFLQNNVENLYNDLVIERHQRMEQYVELLNEQPEYFEGHGGADVHLLNLNNGEYLPAFERYSGRFYNQELRNLYNDKNLNSNLHVLIISGLYGVISFQDTIINYHLMIDNPNAIWGGEDNLTLRNTVQQYMHDNKIKEKNVFYAVSPSTYEDALKPMPEWTDLWIDVPNARNGNNAYSAQCVRAFLENL